MNIVVKEVLLVAMVGSVPVFIIQYKEGVDRLKEFVSGAVVPDYLFYYFSLFFIVHLSLSTFFWLYGYRFSPDRQRYAKSKIRYVGEIGDNTLSVYRLVSGMLFAIPLIWKVVDPSTLANPQLIVLVSFALLFLVGVISISSANAWAKKL